MADKKNRLMVEHEGKLMRKDSIAYRQRYTTINVSRPLKNELIKASEVTGESMRELADRFLKAGLASLEVELKAASISLALGKEELAEQQGN